MALKPQRFISAPAIGVGPPSPSPSHRNTLAGYSCSAGFAPTKSPNSISRGILLSHTNGSHGSLTPPMNGSMGAAVRVPAHNTSSSGSVTPPRRSFRSCNQVDSNRPPVQNLPPMRGRPLEPVGSQLATCSMPAFGAEAHSLPRPSCKAKAPRPDDSSFSSQIEAASVFPCPEGHSVVITERLRRFERQESTTSVQDSTSGHSREHDGKAISQCFGAPCAKAGPKNVSLERRPLSALAQDFVQSIDSLEKKFETTKQAFVGDGIRQLNYDGGPTPRFPDSVTDSPAPVSVYPSDNGSGDSRNRCYQGCSTIPSDESLSAEQLRAYKELEQAEMACELKRMENCLAEERARTAMLQQTFATELMAQKDAHSHDVAALEDMINKVLVENKRLSTIVEGLCNQHGHRGRASHAGDSPASTCASGNSSSRSKRTPIHSGSSGDDTSSSGEFRRISTVTKVLGKQSRLCDSPQPTSSEAEVSTDSEPVPSSDEASHAPLRSLVPKAEIVYTNID